MTGSASELARRLGEHAEAVCREYLSNGHRSGNYWIVGDVRNTRGRSMHVRLKDRIAARRRRASGSMTPRPNMAICSTSSARAAASSTSATSRTRRGASSACPDLNPDPRLQRAASASVPRRRLPRRGAPPVRHGAADRRHAGRTLSAAARHRLCGTRALRCASIPAATTAISRPADTRTFPALIAAVTSLEGVHHRRAAHLAGPRRRRQGAYRRSAPLDGSSARQRHPPRLRCRRADPGHGRRRGPGDDGFAQDRDARRCRWSPPPRPITSPP